MRRTIIRASLFTLLALGNALDLWRGSREVGFDLPVAACFALVAGIEWSDAAKQRRGRHRP